MKYKYSHGDTVVVEMLSGIKEVMLVDYSVKREKCKAPLTTKGKYVYMMRNFNGKSCGPFTEEQITKVE